MKFIFLLLSLKAVYSLYLDEDCLIFPIYPVQYEITLSPYLNGDQFYYEGDITIFVIATASGQNTIQLDSKDLQIHENTVSVKINNRNIVDQRQPIFVDKRRGKVVIYLRESLRTYGAVSGRSDSRYQYQINMRFRGNIKSDNSGFFATSYKERNTVKWVLSTRLSPHYASSVFPCFDNPHIEAGFVLRLYKPPNLRTTLAVSRESRTYNTSSYTQVEFSPSPQIPTYKLALHLSEFSPRYLPSMNSHDSVTVWTRAEEDQNHFFMQNFANRLLSAFNTYTNTSRSITSNPINIVVIPNYSKSYEKGSWNLLTVGESRFLLEPDLVSVEQLNAMEEELARQLCRVWLGNPDEGSKTRWRQEWFKEGMTTYFSHYFLVWGDTHQRGSESLGLGTMFRAMAIDTQNKPLSAYNLTSADISEKDDELVSMKTASILRMIEHWLKTEEFHKAVKDYLNSRLGKTVSIQEFGDCLQRQAVHCEFFKDHSVGNVIASWVNQPGYPVVHVKVYRDRNVVSLSQRFFSPPHTGSSSNFLIPISFTTQFTENCLNCFEPRFIIASPEYTFQENLNNGWIILNRKATGYYRVNYDDANWELIAQTLNGANKSKIDVANRAQIINDVFALHASGLMSMEMARKILSTLQHEEDLMVWDAAIQGYELLKRSREMSRQVYDFWKKFMAQQVSAIYFKLRTKLKTDFQSRITRSRIVSFACSVGLPDCISDMTSLQLGHDGRVADPDTRESFYRMLLNQDNGWYQVKKRLETCSAYENQDILNAKLASEDEKILYKNLPYGPENISFSTDRSPISSQCCPQRSHIQDRECCNNRTSANSAHIQTFSYLIGLSATSAFLFFRSLV